MAEQQLDLIAVDTKELEQTLEELNSLSDGEREQLRGLWPANLQSLAELLRVLFAERNIDKPEQMSEAAVTAIAQYMGGRDLYIPNGKHLKSGLRDIQIWRAFDGRNLHQLARQFDLTERRVAEIIRHQRAAEIARRQQQLF